MPTGVKCPKDGGDIAARRSKKRGKAFYGCENYPSCDFVCWDKPVLEVCPDCGFFQLPRWLAFLKIKALVEGTKIVRKELTG